MYGFFIRLGFIFLLLHCWVHHSSMAVPKSQLPGYLMVFDLNYSWQVYDEKYKSYVPYINVRHKNIKSASFWIDTEDYQGYSLIMYVNNGDTYLFIDKQLSGGLQEEGWHIISVDSLKKVYNKKKLFVTLYDKEYRLPLSIIFIGKEIIGESSSDLETTEDIKDQLPELKSNKRENDFFIVAFFILVILFALLRNIYPKLFLLYYGLRSNFSYANSTSNIILTNPITFKSLLFLLTHSLTFGFFLVIGQKNITGILPFDFFEFQSKLDFAEMLGSYLTIGFSVFVCILLKYILLFLFGLPLKQRGMLNSHFYEYVRLSNWFYVGADLLMMGLLFGYPDLMQEMSAMFVYMIVLFHILQSLAISFYINQEVQFKNLYLFYYLCITELTPLLIGVKFLLFN